VPAIHVDLYPTFLDLAGVKPATHHVLDGESLVPLLRDPTAAWPDRPLFTHLGRWDKGQVAGNAYRQCRVREGKWSLVNVKNTADGWELYDVAADEGLSP
jgi:arylsulfatase